MKMPKKETIAAVAAVILGLIAAKYLFLPLLPFLVAAAVAVLSRKICRKIKIRDGYPMRILSSVTALLIYGGFGTALVMLCRTFYAQALGLCMKLISDSDKITRIADTVSGFFSDVADFLHIDGGAGFSLASAVEKIATDMLGRLPTVAAGVASAVPKVIIFTVVTVLATVYLCADGGRTFEKLRSLPPMRKISGGAWKLLAGTCRAYSVILLLTFSELFLGFSLIGVQYALIVAGAVAVFDIFPVLSTGLVLIPWSLAELLLGDGKTALGLAVIWAVTAVVREIVEPRIVGEGLGIPPVVSLASMYVGLSLFGAAGAIFAPIGTALAVTLWKERKNEAPA